MVKKAGGLPILPLDGFMERGRLLSAEFGEGVGGWWTSDVTNYYSLAALLADYRPDVIVHLAEQPSAPYSMANVEQATETLFNNTVGTWNLLAAINETCPSALLLHVSTMGEYGTPGVPIPEGVFPSGDFEGMAFPRNPGSVYHACYDDDTEVLTRDGWKQFSDLHPADQIASRDLEDDRVRFASPTKIMRYDYDGPMYCLQQRRLSLRVTPNHRMVIAGRGGGKVGAAKIREAHAVQGKAVSYLLSGTWDGEHLDRWIVPTYEWHNHSVAFQRKACAIPLDVWLPFLGWYLAEGSVHTKRKRVDFTQKKGPNSERLAVVCAEVAAYLGAKTGRYNASGDREVHAIHSRQLCEHLLQFGKAADKYIPREVLSLQPSLLCPLFAALMAGDAHRHSDGHWTYHTISRRLADDVQELALRLRYSANISVARQNQYRVNICPTLTMQVNQFPEDLNDWTEHYIGSVWCCEVPGDGIILVRREGKPVWCGNSKVASGALVALAARLWKLRAAVLYQGVVFGITPETMLATRFDVDEAFGTVLNRFCAQAILGVPLTVYGSGGQTRGYISLKDVCLSVPILAQALAGQEPGKILHVNHLTTMQSVLQLAGAVDQGARTVTGQGVDIAHVPNVRIEAEQHDYRVAVNVMADLLPEYEDLEQAVVEVLKRLAGYRDRLESVREAMMPRTTWTGGKQ